MKKENFYVEKDKYYLTKGVFIDIWEKYGCKGEITNKEEIFSILNEIVEHTHGQVNVDQFSEIDYTNICKIKHIDNYTYLYDKDFSDNRKDYLNEDLSEYDINIWKSFYGFSTYIYMLMDIKKLKFVKVKNHIAVLISLNLVPNKIIEDILINENNELINQEVHMAKLYSLYEFYEGDKCRFIKHECIVNNLPYYSCLIQPKIGSFNKNTSRMVLLDATMNEITSRMYNVRESIIETIDYDELASKGNTIRRIIEFLLKYVCVYNGIDNIKKKKIDSGYGKIELGSLHKEVKKLYPDIPMNQTFINIANDLSHDSERIYSTDEVLEFWDKAKNIIVYLKESIFINENQRGL